MPSDQVLHGENACHRGSIGLLAKINAALLSGKPMLFKYPAYLFITVIGIRAGVVFGKHLGIKIKSNCIHATAPLKGVRQVGAGGRRSRRITADALVAVHKAQRGAYSSSHDDKVSRALSSVNGHAGQANITVAENHRFC